jgi:hypothetical protein
MYCAFHRAATTEEYVTVTKDIRRHSVSLPQCDDDLLCNEE